MIKEFRDMQLREEKEFKSPQTTHSIKSGDTKLMNKRLKELYKAEKKRRKKEFNLSEMICHNEDMDFIFRDNVKEFIRLLKHIPCSDSMRRKIDKLAGKELT